MFNPIPQSKFLSFTINKFRSIRVIVCTYNAVCPLIVMFSACFNIRTIVWKETLAEENINWRMAINSPKFLPPIFPVKFNLKCDRRMFTPFIMLILKQPSSVLANPLDKRITSYSKLHLTMPRPLFMKHYPFKYKRSLVVHEAKHLATHSPNKRSNRVL